MKNIFLLLLLSASFSVNATPVNGQIFYKLPNENLAQRVVTLEVPTRGKGEVILTGDKFEWRTTNFFTSKIGKKTFFVMAFKTQFQNFKSTVLFKGIYLKGKNQIIYYGDFYKRKGHHSLKGLEELNLYKYQGGFKFDYLR